MWPEIGDFAMKTVSFSSRAEMRQTSSDLLLPKLSRRADIVLLLRSLEGPSLKWFSQLFARVEGILVMIVKA